MEATGHARWFERPLAELGFELWIGDPAESNKTKFPGVSLFGLLAGVGRSWRSGCGAGKRLYGCRFVIADVKNGV